MSDGLVAEAVKLGRREGLVAMRDKLARDMDEASPAVVAQIAGRLQVVLVELEVLAQAREETLDDVLAKRRKAREQAANPSPRPRRARKPSSG